MLPQNLDKLIMDIDSITSSGSRSWNRLDAVWSSLPAHHQAEVADLAVRLAASLHSELPPWEDGLGSGVRAPQWAVAATARTTALPANHPSPATSSSTASSTASSTTSTTTSTNHQPDFLRGDQPKAWDKLVTFLGSEERFFSLRGYAGTGKSFMMKAIRRLPYNFIFCAPTNKAAAVLSGFLGSEVRTVYSVLGLRMEQIEDKLTLVDTGKHLDLGKAPILVLDEAGMAATLVVDILRRLADSGRLRVIFVGDPAQLNPVGESISKAWALPSKTSRVLMREVLRFDSDLLDVATGIRNALRTRSFDYEFADSAHVRVLGRSDWEASVKSVKDWSTVRCAAWRNRTVDKLNKMVRENLGYEERFVVGEQLLLAAPIIQDGTIVAHTDDELSVQTVNERRMRLPEGDLDTWALSTDKGHTLYVPQSTAFFRAALDARAAKASRAKGYSRKQLWKDFWDLKNAVHEVRYGYAMTVHRLQGTTVNSVYVDRQDILANPDAKEAYRCLYVACTRASHSLSIR